MVKFTRHPRKEYKRRFDTEGKAVVGVSDEGDPEVHYWGRLSTRTRLHELHHTTRSEGLREGFSRGDAFLETPYDFAYEELAADEFAEQTTRGWLSWESIRNVATNLMLSMEVSPAVAMGAITRAMDDLGYRPMERDVRSWLWGELRGHDKERRLQ